MSDDHHKLERGKSSLPMLKPSEFERIEYKWDCSSQSIQPTVVTVQKEQQVNSVLAEPVTFEEVKEIATREANIKMNSKTKDFGKISGFRKNNSMKEYLDSVPSGGLASLQWRLAHMMSQSIVKSFLVVCIISNAFTIGLEADYGDGTLVWYVIEVSFLGIFTLEIILNLFAFGRIFLEDKWNLVDMMIIFLCLVDFGISSISGGGGTALSVVRLVRILRIIRVISALEKMVYLVAAFCKGMGSVMWVLVLWVIALYIFGVLTKGFFGDSEYLQKELKGTLDVEAYFGTIPKAMITLMSFLFFDSSGWAQREIGQVYPLAWILFMVFIVVVSVGLMELMTSLFIDSLMDEKQRMERRKSNENEERRKEVQQMMTGLFDAFDEDGSQTLDKDELAEVLAIFDDEETKGMLENVDLDTSMMAAAIKVADIDGDGEVSALEFTAAMESVHEKPKMCDIRELHQRLGHLKINYTMREEDTAAQIEAVKDQVGRLEALILNSHAVGAVPAQIPAVATLPATSEPINDINQATEAAIHLPMTLVPALCSSGSEASSHEPIQLQPVISNRTKGTGWDSAKDPSEAPRDLFASQLADKEAASNTVDCSHGTGGPLSLGTDANDTLALEPHQNVSDSIASDPFTLEPHIISNTRKLPKVPKPDVPDSAPSKLLRDLTS